MKLTRRDVLAGASAMTLAGAALGPSVTRAQEARGASAPTERRGYTRVQTPDGWTLPYQLKGGVKEFHLVAEEIEHEFAPVCVAKCWGYNGTTPGPTIE